MFTARIVVAIARPTETIDSSPKIEAEGAAMTQRHSFAC